MISVHLKNVFRASYVIFNFQAGHTVNPSILLGHRTLDSWAFPWKHIETDMVANQLWKKYRNSIVFEILHQNVPEKYRFMICSYFKLLFYDSFFLFKKKIMVHFHNLNIHFTSLNISNSKPPTKRGFFENSALPQIQVSSHPYHWQWHLRYPRSRQKLPHGDARPGNQGILTNKPCICNHLQPAQVSLSCKMLR